MITTILGIYIASVLNPFSASEPVEVTQEKIHETNTYSNSFNLASLLNASAQPLKKSEKIEPLLDAASTITVDMGSGKILYEKNAHEKRQFASITKLMTAVIILEENNMNEIVTVSTKAANMQGSKIWLYPGEKIALQNLLYAILIHSGNDAAWALAEHNAENAEAFIEKMNKKAEKLGLTNTHFSNPIGYDDTENYSTAYDLSILGRYAYRKSFVRHAVATKDMSITSINGDITHNLENTNELLDSYLNVKGLKTGHTKGAGLCLAAISENEFGNDILTIILNSPDRFKETKILTDWIFRSFIW
jgi:serine-type D-Ala-D-Ala carboxypeptidase (penicillin-binding protein 5/6)